MLVEMWAFILLPCAHIRALITGADVRATGLWTQDYRERTWGRGWGAWEAVKTDRLEGI